MTTSAEATVADQSPAIDAAVPNDTEADIPANETVVSGVTFSVPVQYDEPLEPYLNLPVVVKDNSMILDDIHQMQEASTSVEEPQESTDSAAQVNVMECPDTKALEIVESIQTTQKLLSYTAALVSGKDIKNDSFFNLEAL